MVRAVRRGEPMRAVARDFGVALYAVQRWVRRAGRQRLDRVDWSDHPAGCLSPANRTPQGLEDVVLGVRKELKEQSALGEYGAVAIHRELVQHQAAATAARLPSIRTIGRILDRRGVLDGQRRIRRPAPPRGWFLPEVYAQRAELDSFDIVQDLRIESGPFVDVLNGISLHGGLCASWPTTQMTAKYAVDSLIEHWRACGLPTYAKFDNDTIFQGAHQFRDAFGRVTRLCLSLGVTPVFAPPRETGFQADIENYNGRWQLKVWHRFHFATPESVVAQSARFVAAARKRAATRIDSAPPRHSFPTDWQLDLQAPLRGTVIYLRRTDDQGQAHFLGHSFRVSEHWCNRLVRAEVKLSLGEIRLYALRRREPGAQPLLATHPYNPPGRAFDG